MNAAGPAFLVKKILIDGNTLFSESELHAYAKDFEGKTLSFQGLQRFADILTAQYIQRGYTTTRAYIPPQKVVDGIVKVSIMEGRVGDIGVEGNRWFRKLVYRNALPLQSGDFFEMSDLENAIREIDIKPDRSARAYLEPGKKPGTTDITLKAKDSLPVHASYEFNTRGSKLTHRQRHVFHLTDNNLLGFGDSLAATFSIAEQGAILGGAFNYDFPWAQTGTIFHLAAAVAKSRLQGDLRPLDVKGQSYSFIPGMTQRLLTRARWHLDGELQFEFKDSKTVVGDSKLSWDRSRALVTGLHATVIDSWGQTFGGSDLHVGLPGFMGGSVHRDDLASRIETGGDFVYGTLNAARLQRLPFDSVLVLQASGQLSPQALNSLEQTYLGGIYSVRGYPENDSGGDNGYSFSTEVRVPPYFIPKKWPVPGFKDKTWRDAIALVGFIDGGQVFNYNRQQNSSEKNRTLLGTGFGARFYISQDLNVQFDLGFPFGDRSTDNNIPRVHLSARAGF